MDAPVATRSIALGAGFDRRAEIVPGELGDDFTRREVLHEAEARRTKTAQQFLDSLDGGFFRSRAFS